MKNKDKILITVSWLLCAVALACAAYVATVLFVPGMSIRIRYFVLLMLGVFVLPTAAILLRSMTQVNEHIKRRMAHGCVLFMFALYIIVFLGLLVFTKFLSNHAEFTLVYNKYWLSDALPRLIPFSSLTKQISSFALGRTSGIILAINIGGNLLLYTPLAFFVPACSKNMRSFDSFLPLVFFAVVFVELLQGMFGLGSFETDDMILGIGGALIAYAVVNCAPLRDFFEKNHLYF